MAGDAVKFSIRQLTFIGGKTKTEAYDVSGGTYPAYNGYTLGVIL